MKKLWLAITACSIAWSSMAQTADDVFAKHLEAIGGLDKIKSVQSVYMEGVSVAPNGMEITSKTWRIQGKLFRQEINFGMGSMTTLVTDKDAWFSNPRNGGAFEAMPAEMRTRMSSELYAVTALTDYAAAGGKVELAGMEKVENTDCYVIKLSYGSGNPTTFYIDNKNWYVIRTSTKGRMGGGMMGGGNRGGAQAGQEVEMKIDYTDFTKTREGIVFPMTIKRPGMGGATMATNIEKVEVNPKIDASLSKPE